MGCGGEGWREKSAFGEKGADGRVGEEGVLVLVLGGEARRERERGQDRMMGGDECGLMV